MTNKQKKCVLSYQFGMLSCHAVSILNQRLKLVVLCESDDLQDSPKLRENLENADHNFIDDKIP